MKIVLIHGMNDPTHGQNNVNRLVPHLKKLLPKAEFDTNDATYGRIGLLVSNYLWRFTWIVKIVPRIMKALDSANVVICHSNGAHFCMQALKRMCKPNIKIIFLSAALDIDYKFDVHFRSLSNFHSRNDDTVKKARLLPWSDWGAGGAYGFNSNDERIENLDRSRSILEHSQWFVLDKIEKTAEDITHEILYS